MPPSDCEGLKPPAEPEGAPLGQAARHVSRREMLRRALTGAGLLGLGVAGVQLARSRARRARASGPGSDAVWQIDPRICIACGKCATNCVLEPSAVRCVHAFKICGYCDLCSGFFELEHARRDSGAENQLCPMGAITRTFVADPYFEYTVDPALCIGCGKCVKGCEAFGNGSLFLQVRHDICLGCNECSIAAACPSGAFVRRPASDPYILKDEGIEGDGDGKREEGKA